MSKLIITESAALGLERCRGFLAKKNPQASLRASQSIKKQFELLILNPNMGRPLNDLPELRELLIFFGDSGYVALYRYNMNVDAVIILAFKHQKEAGY